MKTPARHPLSRLLPLFAALLLACPGLCHAAAGHFQFVSGEVRVEDAGGRDRIGRKGDAVNQGDTVVTAKAASAQLRMEDGGILAVRQESRLRIDTFNYNGTEDGSERGLFSLVKGSFRSITGAIGHTNRENLKIRTSSATIGIRGTDGEIGFNPDTNLTGVRTIAGRHAVTAPDAGGNPVTLVTDPGRIVLVVPGHAPAFANRFPFASATQKPAAGNTSASGKKDDDDGTAKDGKRAGNGGNDARREARPASTQATGLPLATAPLTGTDPATGETALLSTAPGITKGSTTTTTPMPEPPPPAPSVIYEPYGVSWAVPCPGPGFPCAAVSSEPGAKVARDASGAPIAFDRTGPNGGRNISLVNPVLPTRSQAPGYAVTGIEYGTWQVGAVDWTSNNPAGSGTDTPLPGSLLHWFTAAGIKPGYLPQILTGTANYSFDGGTAPTNQKGVAGSVVSAALAANFTNQTVDLSFGLSVNAHNWTVSATGQPISHEFFGAPSALVSIDGCITCGAQGRIDGRFTGMGGNGAAVVYGLGGGSFNEEVNGVLAFVNSAAPNDPATPYRPVGIAGYDPGATPSAVVNGQFNAVGRVATDGAGNLVSFDGQISGTQQSPDKSVVFAVGSATPTDLGGDANTGLVWGRWAGGSVSVTSRSGGTAVSLANPGSLHYLAGPVGTAPVLLPLSGTYAYTLVGGTRPTDQQGNLGTLASVRLDANFSTRTVDASVSASVAGTTLTGTATGMPIMPDNVSSAGPASQGGVPLAVNCAGSCGATNTGNLGVVFVGPDGKGAGMLYSLQTSGATNKTISGAAGLAR